MAKQENINKRLIFGLKLKQARANKGYSLAQLSDKAGISISFLNEIEKGKKHPKPEKVGAIAKALGVSQNWLEASDLDKKLSPLAELIQSNILHELPLDMFGLKMGDLLELLSNAPTKLNAFIGSLIEVTKNYDLSVETFYFAVMRSYQEIHDNYFEDLEIAAVDFAEQFHLSGNKLVTTEQLQHYLEENWGYEIIEDGFDGFDDLQNLRSFYRAKGKRRKLYLNKGLNERQKAFIFGKEVAYQFLNLKERPDTSSWVEITSFDQVINNFKASYFSTSILINQQHFLKDLTKFLKSKKWQEGVLLETMEQYNATPEMILQRMTNLLPKYFEIKNIFFLRFNHEPHTDHYELTKELHLSSSQSLQGALLREHHCRRWMAFSILQQLDDMLKLGYKRRAIGGVQRMRILDTGNEYLTLNLARPNLPTKGVNSSLTLGMLVDEKLKSTVGFVNDKAIKFRLVNETCERCKAENCKMRVASPRVWRFNKRIASIKASLEELI
ncbi:MAG: helix-turn-helix domain-containing protein [Cyclobacteriaceae bacterium]